MKQFLLRSLIVFLFSCSMKSINAQCTLLIPANVNVLSHDTLIDCSNLVTQRFLLCPGVHVTWKGSSTCFNAFYMESGSTLTFNDTLPSVPYGMFSFYVKSGATLDYNIGAPTTFPFIDTLRFEPGATLIDTGHVFHDSSHCASLVFDYSLLPGGVSPCGLSSLHNVMASASVGVYPNPAREQFTVDLSEFSAGNYTVECYNAQGQLISSNIVQAGMRSQISTSTFHGMLWYVIRGESGLLSKGCLMVE